MLRVSFASVCTILLASLASPALGQISPSDAASLGLELHWTAALKTSLAEPGKTSVTLWQSSLPAKTSIEVAAAGKTVLLDTSALGSDGQPIGVEGAKAQAEMMAKRMRFAGLKPLISEKTSPTIFLLSTASDGAVELMDAESGKSLWATQVGQIGQPTFPATINDKFVVVTNGSTIYLLETATGKSFASFRSEDAPGEAAFEMNGRVYLVAITGRVLSYAIEDLQAEPWRFVYGGRSMIRPAFNRVAMSIAVPVEPKYTYFFSAPSGSLENADAFSPSPLARLESQAPVVATPVPFEDSFIVASRSGEIFRINPALGGKIAWTASTGSVLYDPPIVTPAGVFVVTDEGILLGYDSATGDVLPGWGGSLTAFKQVLAVSGDRVYARNTANQLVAIDRTNGKILGAAGENLRFSFSNRITDRLYVVTNSGTVQCYAQKGMVTPQIHEVLAPPPAKEEKGKKPAAPAAKPADSSAEEDPFGGANSTTDEGAMEEPAMEEPANEADPFGNG